MRIAIPDDYQSCIKKLKAYQLLDGHQVTIINSFEPDPAKLAKKMGDPEALVLTRTRTKVDNELLQYLPNLKVISQTGKNPGHINVDDCRRRGVVILEGRGNPISTSELTWALIMNGLRLLPQAISGMQAGHWQVNIGKRVHGKKIGIWGYGKIGKMVAGYAKAFGAEVIVWGSKESRNKAQADGFIAAESKAAFFSTCDVVTLHLRLKEQTKELITYEDLSAMKPEALFVNTARAGLIQPGALLRALQAKRPGYAAIDVFDEEPIYDKDHPFLTMDNVICTPHLGYVEQDNYELYFGIAFENLIKYWNE